MSVAAMIDALPTQRQAVARALAYPYQRPRHSFCFGSGIATPLTERALACLSDDEREALIPVLAVGSNAAPEQLRRKFGSGADVMIPVTLGLMRGADVAYSAYMTRYGSVPATLVESPGVSVAVGITWLSPKQLAQMHKTESVGSNTDYGTVNLEAFELSQGLALPGKAIPRTVFTYQSRLGVLGMNGEPVPLAELAAFGRRSLALTQQQLQRRVRRWTAQALLPDRVPIATDFSQWVLGNVIDKDRRRQVGVVLQSRQIARGLGSFERLGIA